MSLSASLSPQVSPIEIGPRSATHLLNRLGFGPRPGDIGRILKRGLTRYVEEQLDAPPDPDLESRLRPLATLAYPLAQVAALYAADDRSFGRVLEEFLLAKIIRAVHGENQLQEALVDFWFNHFNVYLADGFDRAATPSYERDAIRPHVLGRFRDLLGATAAHPAMLYYLDNYLSTVSRMDPRTGKLIQGLNENYGRELMELHTVGVDAGYTQDHVSDSARCFTGWGIDLRGGGGFVYRPQLHDPGAKTVMTLNLPAGGGRDDGEKLLDYLAVHPATAHHISWQLAQRFVADEPPASLVDRTADTFLRTGGDLREVMRTLIGSAEFWAEAFGTGKPKTPFEYVASCLRAVDAEVMTSPARGADGRGADPRSMAGAVSAMGMPLYFCVPPTGYSNKGSDWLNPSSQLAHMNFALDLASGAIQGVGVDPPGLIRRLGGNPDDPQSMVGILSSEIFGKGLSAQTRAAASQVSRGGPVSVVSRVVGLVLAGPEMQVR
jgi:uncharacterized protein (DUF1800 family)